MPISHNEIIEEIEGHIRKFGAEPSEWCVGTAKDSRGPFFRRHLAADLGHGLIYREAFTTSAADQVIDHLVNACGLRPDHSSVPEPGKIVFVYRRTRDSGLGTRDSGCGARQTRLGVGDSGRPAGDSGFGVGDSGRAEAGPPAPRSDQAPLQKLAA